MRNRGIELFMLPDQQDGLAISDWNPDTKSAGQNLAGLIAVESFPGPLLPSVVLRIHSDIRCTALKRHRFVIHFSPHKFTAQPLGAV